MIVIATVRIWWYWYGCYIGNMTIIMVIMTMSIFSFHCITMTVKRNGDGSHREAEQRRKRSSNYTKIAS